MEFEFLLDTNILSDLIRNPSGIVRDKIESVGESKICTNVIVAAEIRYGCQKRKSARLTRQANKILDAIPTLAFESPADRFYGEIRSDLEAKGMPIGPNDLLIAAQAKALKLTLVSDNFREFSRVKGLKVQNWLSR